MRASRLPAGLLLFAFYLLPLAFSPPAHADPSGADKAMAETLFRAGRQLMTDGKVAEACERFAESQRLDPKLGTLLNLALCHEQQGKTASAYGEFVEVAAQAKRAGQADREEFARAHASALEAKLSRLLLAGAAASGMKLTLDGQPLGTSAIGTPLPVDPGDHVIVAEAPGKKRWESRVSVPPGPGTTTIPIPTLEDALPAPPPLTPPPPPVVAPPIPAPILAPPPPGPGGARIAGIVIGSLGLASLVAGGVTGGLAFAREAEARKSCPDTACPNQPGLDAHNEASRFAAASTALFVAGGVAAAGGLVLVLVSRDNPSARSAWVLPSASGIVVGGRW